MSDPFKVNHLAWDGLGNPYSCTDPAHVHPADVGNRFPDGLTDAQIEMALTDEEFAKTLNQIPRWKRWVFWPVAVAHTALIFAGRGLRKVPWWALFVALVFGVWALVMGFYAQTSPGTVIAWCAILATAMFVLRPRETTVHNDPIQLTLSLHIDPSTGETKVDTNADAASIAPLPGLFDRNDERARRGMRGE